MDGSTATTSVATTSGPVRGIHQDGLAVFKGVPYAAAPVGDLRWRPAVPHPGWVDVLDGTEFGPSAPQPYAEGGQPILGGHGFPPFDEDCLTLNIWTPAADAASRPVMIWIHGGGYVTGSGSLPVYSGDTFARDGDLVVVTINYRLGPLGCLYTGSETDGPDAQSANFWITDQIAALRWVCDNIAAFGGDPAAITIAGQSAGAFSAAALASHPDSRSLFHRAIVQSSPFDGPMPDRANAREITGTYLDILGVNSIDELRKLPWETLIDAWTAMYELAFKWGHWVVPFPPVMDGVSLIGDPVHYLVGDAALDVDVLIGWTNQEANSYFPANPKYAEVTREQVLARYEESFGDGAAEAYASFEARRPGATPLEVLMDLGTEELFATPTIAVAEQRAARGRPVWLYRFDFQSPALSGRLGAAHCLDLPFVFDNFDRWSRALLTDGIESPDRDGLCTAMHEAWISFIRTGDPNHAALPNWERYAGDNPTTMRFDTVSGSIDGPRTGAPNRV